MPKVPLFVTNYADNFGILLQEPRRCFARMSDGTFREIEKFRPVTIKGFERLDFLAHHHVARSWRWTITEGASGRAIVGEVDSRKDAIAALEKYLSIVTYETMMDNVARAILDTGLSPRYAEVQRDTEDADERGVQPVSVEPSKGESQAETG